MFGLCLLLGMVTRYCFVLSLPYFAIKFTLEIKIYIKIFHFNKILSPKQIYFYFNFVYYSLYLLLHMNCIIYRILNDESNTYMMCYFKIINVFSHVTCHFIGYEKFQTCILKWSLFKLTGNSIIFLLQVM